MNAASPEDRLWHVQDVSAFLGVPVETLYRWRKYGSGPPGARVGRFLRYDPAKVRAWVRDREAA
ncbi:helix-turn-helix transcriptional regulator [Dactylosporangium cerinum]|uniref:Helix-turn-helix transcriptional regulator n=1 Tax=Dactylosporangium cerinum TaxID=1434730 RepID=A0ABV9WJX3_9ACTN